MEDQAFELDDATVTVPTPEGAKFNDLQGLAEGERHLTWTAGPEAFFMVSAGADPAYTPAALPDDVDSDEPAPLAGTGARRVAYRETKRRPRRIVEGRGSVPEQTIRLVSDLVFVPGEHEQLRIGYRVPEDAPEELRSLLARMLDGVKVRRRDG